MKQLHARRENFVAAQHAFAPSTGLRPQGPSFGFAPMACNNLGHVPDQEVRMNKALTIAAVASLAVLAACGEKKAADATAEAAADTAEAAKDAAEEAKK